MKKVLMQTSKGAITLELDEEAAPITTANFLEYAENRHYDGTIFHRVIQGFMIQGGGLTKDLRAKPTYEPIINEASNGLKNKRGTIAMARTSEPDSATCQFFINHQDNAFLDYRGPQPDRIGIEGMDVVDKIGKVQTGAMDRPAKEVKIMSAKVIA